MYPLPTTEPLSAKLVGSDQRYGMRGSAVGSRAPTGFAELGVPPRIDEGLAACGFAQPFNIQTEAIPVAMRGDDVCGRAKTGSGKTLAFGIPMLARITDKAAPTKPLGLVLVPTRELAIQVAEVLQPVAQHAGMNVLPVYGGASRHHQVEEMAKGIELVVATPLRLIDLIKSNEVSLEDVQIVKYWIAIKGGQRFGRHLHVIVRRHIAVEGCLVWKRNKVEISSRLAPDSPHIVNRARLV